jgi:putative ABC transport system permease protein
VATLKEQAGQHVSRGLYLLMGAVAFLLFIACANVINLLVARTAARRREFAVRAALGAGRSRIARQLMTENVLLATIGTALGIAVSLWATKAMLALVPGSMPRADDVRLDWRIGLAVGAVAIAVGGAFGLAATLQVTWRRLAGTLNDATARTTGGRTRRLGRRALVMAEVSLSLMLVIGAALLTTSFVRLQRVEPGFNPHGALTAGVSLPITGGFDPQRDGPEWARFFQQLVDRLTKSAGVVAAGAISALPVTSTAEGGGTAIVGKPALAPGEALSANYLVVEGDAFGAAGITLRKGRVFNSGDLATAPLVAVVNREYERRYLEGDALGKQVNTFFDFSNGAARTIVGVVDDVQFRTLDAEPWPQIYVAQQQMAYPGLNVIVRTKGDPAAFLSVLKREVKGIDPRLAVSQPRTLDDVFDESLARRRFSMTLIGIFAASALVLAMVGLYGVIALSVSHRHREIGIRMALGARPTDVLRMVLGEGVRITLAGVVAGLVGAFALSRLVSSLLFGVSATSTGIYAVATTVIVGVTLVASYLPARRATRVDPTSALRAD